MEPLPEYDSAHPKSRKACVSVPHRSQVERRRRIIASATTLATHGYESCQMRAVGTLAGVAPSTVYSYFPSKDDLLLACLQQWLCDFETEHLPRLEDADPYARLLAVTSALIDSLTRAPRFADAMVRSYLYADGAAAARAEVVRQQMTGILLAAMRDCRSAPAQHVVELFLDVCLTNVPAIAQRRATMNQLMQRLGCTLTAVKHHHPDEGPGSRAPMAASVPT